MEISRNVSINDIDTGLPGNQKSSWLTEEVFSGTWIWYVKEDRVLFSERFARIAGVFGMVSCNFTIFFEIIHGNDLLPFLHAIEDILLGVQSSSICIRIVKPDNIVQNLYCHMESLKSEFADIFDIAGVCFECGNR